MPQTIPLNFLPGLQRDGTHIDSDACIDALWTRWRLGRPRKMRGYQLETDRLNGIGRRIHMFYKGPQVICHVGTSVGLQQIVIDSSSGAVLSVIDRTPAIFAGGTSVGWTLDAIFDTTSSVVQLVAHSVPNIDIVANIEQTPVFIGTIDDTAPLVPLPPPSDTGGGTYTPPNVAGGIVCVQPYVFDFDLAGFVGWSAPNIPASLGVSGGTTGAGQARVSAQKVVAGLPLRGGGTASPAAIFWSLSEVITANFIGSPAIFAFNTVSPNSSILSAQSVIEYDGLYLWAGVDRFLMYNGTVIEIPNTFNQDWFFDNLNPDAAGKSFAFKVPRYGEVWFCAPLFGNIEPSHAAIYNIREKCWYDTALPNGGRTAGYFAQGFRYPVMSSPLKNSNGYKLWLHERGVDQIGDGSPAPIRTYFETPFFGGPRSNPPDDRGMSFLQMEPDIQQKGDMVAWISGSYNARGGDASVSPVFIKASPSAAEQMPGFKATMRLGRLHIESNTLGGDYIMGRSILHVDAADMHKMGGTETPNLTSPTLPSGATPPPLTETTVPLNDFLPTP